jgi:cysteinyl-tRNA synthetase
MNDDFNTPQAIAILYDMVKISNTELSNKKIDENKLCYLNSILKTFLDDILGLKMNSSNQNNSIENELVGFIIEMRNDFRKNKDFKMSDQIREKLLTFGVMLKDGPEGTTYTR